jgi:hypothetical protein
MNEQRHKAQDGKVLKLRNLEEENKPIPISAGRRQATTGRERKAVQIELL